MSDAHHVLFAGGGSAGHFFPGLGIASHLVQKMPSLRVTFAGPGQESEPHIVRALGYEHVAIPSQPVPHGPWQALRFVTDNVVGYCAAKWILREKRVSLVVGLGGYTSTAVVRAAAARGIPFLLLEQNAIPSRTTRWLSSNAMMVCAGYQEVKQHLPKHSRVCVTGNPVRSEIEQHYRRYNSHGNSETASTIPFRQERPDEYKRLVVIGGVEGANSLNRSVPEVLKSLRPALKGWRVVHQTGKGQLQETETRYKKYGIEALTVSYIDEIAPVIFSSDAIIARAGGTTLAELALAGTPAILVPCSLAMDDHQMANANVVASAGGCRLIDETASLNTVLTRELQTLLTDEDLRKKMSRNLQRFAQPQAAEQIAAMILQSLGGQCRVPMAA